MKVLELFSGIGGMHYACKGSKAVLEVVAAVEINPVANDVYKYNFPSTKLFQKNIQSLSIDDINRLSPDVILMSPPCQPFTRNGLKGDVNDNRTNPLLHLIALLPNLQTVQYLLVENVKGFETSEARDRLIGCLETAGFQHQEFILSPTQFGIPNTRHRYYLLAKKSDFCFEVSENIIHSFPFNTDKKTEKSTEGDAVKIKDILETTDETSDFYKSFLIPSKLLEKYLFVLDIVTPDCERSCCFTKTYSHYLKGTGSVLSNLSLNEVKNIVNDLRKCEQGNLTSVLPSLNLRFFSPKEISSLMCFPHNFFKFPHNCSLKQQYRLLGNSVNVLVVANLIQLLLENKI